MLEMSFFCKKINLATKISLNWSKKYHLSHITIKELFFRPWFCRKTSFLTKIAEDDLSLYYRALANRSPN
jgi:hypothetical protein